MRLVQFWVAMHTRENRKAALALNGQPLVPLRSCLTASKPSSAISMHRNIRCPIFDTPATLLSWTDVKAITQLAGGFAGDQEGERGYWDYSADGVSPQPPLRFLQQGTLHHDDW